MKWLPLNEHSLAAEPHSETEWMMQQGDIPDVDLAHIEVVEEAVNKLSPAMQDVIYAVFYERVPYSELGERLGCSKTQAWRKAQYALAHLKHELANNPIITERYNMHTNWRSAAKAIINSYECLGDRPADTNLIDFCAREITDAVNSKGSVPSYAMNRIGIEAVHELKHRNLWDPEAFLNVLCAKQADYGHNNINAFGIIGVAVRLHDKVARLFNLIAKNGDALNEPLLDTWLDMVGYSVIAEMLYTDTFNLELEG